MSKVIIIGSGLGGLSCGYILQKNGYEVTILERNMHIGGCLQSFFRGGVKFETGMHFIGSAAQGQTMHRMMNYFGMTEEVRLYALDTMGYDTISFAGESFRFPNGEEAFVEQMSASFPREKDNLRRYFALVKRIASASTLNSLTSKERDLAASTEYQTRSINEVLDELFDDEMLRNVLVGNLPLYAAELDKTPFSQHAFITEFYNQSSFRVVGGSDVIAHSLANSIRKMGGRIFAGRGVSHICCNDTQAVGVETADECFFPADYVISTVHPARLMEMLDTKLIRPAFRSRLRSIPNTTSCFSLYVKFKENTMPYLNTNYYGYKASTPWNCENYIEEEWPKGFLYMHHCHEEAPRYARSGVVLSYMRMADVANWKGTTVGHRGRGYEEFKRVHAERLIRSVEEHLPGFASAIDSYYTSTPLTYLDYTGTEDGSMYGVAKDISLGAAGRVPYRTKVPNLLLAGQNTNSHGMMGVIVGTIVTCSELIPTERLYKQILENG